MAPPQPDLFEHITRSVRGWLHGLYPDLDILIERRREAAGPSRPAFRLEVLPGYEVREMASGWNEVLVSIMVNYGAAPGPSSVFEAQRVGGAIVTRAKTDRVPLYLYNLAWPDPSTVEEVDNVGGSLPAALDVAVAAVAADGTTSAPEAPIRLAVPFGRTLRVIPSPWPKGGPLAASWRLYAAAAGQPLTLQASWADGAAVPVLAALVAGAAPPNQARLRLSTLRTTEATSDVRQVEGVESTWDAYVTIRLATQVPKVFHGPNIAPALIPS